MISLLPLLLSLCRNRTFTQPFKTSDTSWLWLFHSMFFFFGNIRQRKTEIQRFTQPYINSFQAVFCLSAPVRECVYLSLLLLPADWALSSRKRLGVIIGILFVRRSSAADVNLWAQLSSEAEFFSFYREKIRKFFLNRIWIRQNWEARTCFRKRRNCIY